MEEYFSIGSIAGTFGTEGELVLRHNLGKKTGLKGLDVFFIEESNGKFLPYFIEAARVKNDTEVYLKVEGFATKEAARRLQAKKVWLRESDFQKFAGKSAPITLIGYTLLDGSAILGIIREVIEQPLQILCRLEVAGKEVLVPLNEATIRKVDHKKRQVLTELPEGLLDVYLS
ncbi:MAG: ribosome maturation factor RimM [Lacibacter sp.]|jgi:16S rRNA processing protein RimM